MKDLVDIVGYEGLYKINKQGDVWSCRFNGKLLKNRVNKDGYVITCFIKNKKIKGFYAHRLVAIAFIPNPENKPHINHKNGIKTDNRVENLEWCTRSENMKHAWATGLNKNTANQRKACAKNNAKRAKAVYKICPISNKILKEFKSFREAARHMGVAFSSIGIAVRNNRISRGYRWRKKN